MLVVALGSRSNQKHWENPTIVWYVLGSDQAEGSDKQFLVNFVPAFLRYWFFQLFLLPCKSSPLLCTACKTKDVCVSAVSGRLGANSPASAVSASALDCRSGVAQQQTVRYADFAISSNNASARQGWLRMNASSVASTICSVLVSHLSVPVSVSPLNLVIAAV